MKWLQIYMFLLFIIVQVLNYTEANHEGKFYWREWNGTIPSDAVAGGIDKKGQITYIGSTFFPQNSGIIPTVIYKDDPVAHGHLGPFHLVSATNTLILCAPPNSQPTWKKVNLATMLASRCEYIRVGYHEETKLYLGRTYVGSKLITGKIFPAGHKYQGLEVWDDQHVGPIMEFEALGYCPYEPSGGEAIKVPVHCVSCLFD